MLIPVPAFDPRSLCFFALCARLAGPRASMPPLLLSWGTDAAVPGVFMGSVDSDSCLHSRGEGGGCVLLPTAPSPQPLFFSIFKVGL